MLKKNPHMVEDSAWSASGNDYVISFPVVAKKGSLYKNDIKGVKHLELVKLAQQSWVEFGTDEELCVNKTVRHNVSNTITVDDWDEVEDYVWKNKAYFAGISFIADTGDKDYYQAPNTKIETADQIVKLYGAGSVFASGLIVDSHKLWNNLWAALAFANRADPDHIEDVLKRDWVRRYHKYAKNYFAGDLKKAEYCLKDVHLLHKWFKIQQTFIDIDWVAELQEKRYTDINTTGAAACVGVNERGEASCFI
jgi:ribonucleoside-diphosphate reductase alpha chain